MSSLFEVKKLGGDNARHLVSRNKREGGYVGWRVLGADFKKPGHQRQGKDVGFTSLRGLAKWRDRTWDLWEAS